MGLGLLTLALISVAERRRVGLAWLAGRLPAGRFFIWLSPVKARLSTMRSFIASRLSAGVRVPYVTALLLLALLAGLPLLQMKMMNGHDAVLYVTRAVEFWEGLQGGQIFPRWAPDLNFGYGEPIFNFLPPVVYYLMALFRAMGTSFVAGQNLACLLLFAVAGLGMFGLAAELLGKRGGLVAAAAYLFAPYVLTALYVRQALGDFSAFASIPFAFWGIYRYSQDGRHRFLLAGAAAVALLMLSSNHVALMGVPALIAWAAWLSWREQSRRALVDGLAPIAMGVGLTTFFWLPALAERGAVQAARVLEGYLNYRNHFVYPAQFVISPWGYGLSLPGPVDGMSFTLGPVHLIAVAAAPVLLWRMRGWAARGRSWLAFFLALLAAAVFFASTLSQPIWALTPLLQYLQFPWRFLSLAAFSSALVCGAVFASVSEVSARYGRRIPGALLAATLAGLVLWGLPKAQPEKFLAFNEADHSSQAIAARGIATTTSGEWAPLWVQQRPAAPAAAPVTFVSGQGRVVESQLSVSARRFIIEVVAESRLRLNTFYFPGWTLYVDGVERPTDYSNPQGVMEFSLGSGLHGVKFVFEDTPVRAWAGRLSLLALLLLVGVGLAGVVCLAAPS